MHDRMAFGSLYIMFSPSMMMPLLPLVRDVGSVRLYLLRRQSVQQEIVSQKS